MRNFLAGVIALTRALESTKSTATSTSLANDRFREWFSHDLDWLIIRIVGDSSLNSTIPELPGYRVAGGGAGGDARDAQASALRLPYGQPQLPKPKEEWATILGHSPDVADALIQSMILS